MQSNRLSENQRTALDYNDQGLKEANADEALQWFLKAIKKDPHLAQARHNAGLIYYRKRDYVQAEVYIKKCIELSEAQNIPRVTSEAYCSLARISIAQRDYSDAEKYSGQAISIHSKNVGAYSLRGTAHLCLQNYTQAIQDALQAIAFEPNEADHYVSLAKIFLKQRQYKKVIPYLEKAIQLNDQHAFAHYLLGWIYHYRIVKPDSFILWHYFMASEYCQNNNLSLSDDFSLSKDFNEFLKKHSKTELIGYIKELSNQQAYRLISSALFKENTFLWQEFHTNPFTKGAALQQLNELYEPLKKLVVQDQKNVAYAAIAFSYGRTHALFSHKDISAKIAVYVADVSTREESEATVNKVCKI